MKKPSPVVPILIFVLLFAIGSFLVGEAVCSDGWASPSIGKRGACSSHGGVRKWPGYLVLIFSLVAAVFYYIKRNDAYKKYTDGLMASDLGSEGERGNLNQEKNIKVISSPAKNENPFKTKKIPSSESISTPRCPKCRSKMILRVAKRGKNIGGKFWGCRKFPRCRGTSPFVEEARKDVCSKCNNSSMVEIIYGYPTEEAFKDAEAGKVALGGCIIFDDGPIKRCLECGHEE